MLESAPMNNRNAWLVIIIEELAVIGLGLCLLVLMAGVFLRWQTQPVTSIEIVYTTPAQSPTPTRQATPTLTVLPSLTPTVSPTRLPWKSLTQCAALDQPGEYHLDADVQARGDCLQIVTSNIILDCLGHALKGSDYTGYGVVVRKSLAFGDPPHDIEIRNCRVSNFLYGIYIESANRLAVHGNDASDNFDDVERGSRYGKFLGMTEGGGIRLNDTTDAQVFGNTTKRQAIGIDVQHSHNVIVRANVASNNSAWGINLLQTQASQVISNTVADNIRQCTWGAGVIGEGCDAGGIILQDGSSDNVIASNTVTGRNGNGVFIKAHALPCGDRNTISGNTISGALYNSIELGFCVGNKISYNTLRDGLDGIWLGFAHDTEIRDNIIVNMRNHGIISSNSHNITVSGNQITNSNEGIYFYSENYDRAFFYWLPPGEYRSFGNCLCGNVFQSNQVAVHLSDATNNQITGNALRGNARDIWMQGNQKDNQTQGNTGWLGTLSFAGL